MQTKTFIALLSLTTISALLGPAITEYFSITWQAYCMLQGSILSLLGSYLGNENE